METTEFCNEHIQAAIAVKVMNFIPQLFVVSIFKRFFLNLDRAIQRDSDRFRLPPRRDDSLNGGHYRYSSNDSVSHLSMFN